MRRKCIFRTMAIFLRTNLKAKTECMYFLIVVRLTQPFFVQLKWFDLDNLVNWKHEHKVQNFFTVLLAYRKYTTLRTTVHRADEFRKSCPTRVWTLNCNEMQYETNQLDRLTLNQFMFSSESTNRRIVCVDRCKRCPKRRAQMLKM